MIPKQTQREYCRDYRGDVGKTCRIGGLKKELRMGDSETYVVKPIVLGLFILLVPYLLDGKGLIFI